MRLGDGRGRRTGDGVVLRIVLQFFRTDGRAEEVLEVLEDILLRRREGARLGLRVEGGVGVGHVGACGVRALREPLDAV